MNTGWRSGTLPLVGALGVYAPSVATTPEQPARGRLAETARLFLTLGVIGFGGPAAHIAMMRDEVVRRRQWLDDTEFLQMVGAVNLIPGPNSTELAIHLGSRRAGARGLVVAGVCFIVPAVLIVSVIAWLYERYDASAVLVDLRYGILPVIIAVIAHALYGLTRSAVTDVSAGAVVVLACAGYLFGVNELVMLVVAGAALVLWRLRLRAPDGRARSVALPLVIAAAAPVSLHRLFLVFLEIGSVLYGSGYVLLAFLQRHLVDGLGWITEQQLLDALAIGQVTPGPVFTTATFIGWQVEGPLGAAVATLGIFAPAFVFVAVLGRLVPWIRTRPLAAAFLDGVTLGSLGLMGGVLVRLVDVALVDAVTIGVAVVALAVMVRTSLNSAWLVGAGVVVGVLHGVLG